MSVLSNTYTNPIIPGFHPDPSICRVGEDYFLVTSSFAYFPGVPLFHGRDLVHWRQIGYCLDRPEQLHLDNVETSGGIFAPTIRYHAGTFYMITTNVSGGGNFYVTTQDPFSPWSAPVWLAQGGIDPSLLFDENRVYLTTTGMTDDPEQREQGILQSEIDVATGRLLTKPRLIWQGTGGSYPEGPHLYRIEEKYYLMIAEGGTEYGHTEVIARSDSPWGPWENCPHNPILTHRSYHHPIQALGHADMVQAHDGSWWAVCLGIRPNFPQAHHLGRETFLAPVEWDSAGWPHIGNRGRIELEMESPRLTPVAWESPGERDDFDGGKLAMPWNFLGTPQAGSWTLTRRPGSLCLQGNKARLDEGTGVVFVGRRQEQFNCEAAASLRFSPTEGEEAGLTVWKDGRHHYELFVTAVSRKRFISVRRRIGSLLALAAQEEIFGEAITLMVRANRLLYTFAYLTDDGREHVLAAGETRYLSTEVTGGFTGVYFALYASGNGRNSSTPACFDWFEYRDLEQPGFLSIDSTVSELLQDRETQVVLEKHLPELVAHPPAEWGANLSLVSLCAVSPGVVTTEALIAADAELRQARIPSRK